MKKQLLAAAVAATMASVASADVSISGNAKYEYKNTEDTAGSTTNSSHTEVNIGIVGKTGDTKVVLNTEWNQSGAVDSSATAGKLDVEDMYVETKIGDITLKMGDYATGNGGFLGEIDNGTRGTDKVTASGTFGGVKVAYGSTPNNGGGDTVTLSMPIAGNTVSFKESPNTYSAYGIAGDMSGIAYRVDHVNADASNADATFVSLTGTVNDVTMQFAQVELDDDATVGNEDDSSIFANSIGSSAAVKTNVTGVRQFMASTKVGGNTVKLRIGTMMGQGTVQDADFSKIDVTRALAGGATLALSYKNVESTNIAAGSTMTDTSEFEADISVKF